MVLVKGINEHADHKFFLDRLKSFFQFSRQKAKADYFVCLFSKATNIVVFLNFSAGFCEIYFHLLENPSERLFIIHFVVKEEIVVRERVVFFFKLS